MIRTPACFVVDGAITRIFYQWEPFTGSDGVKHTSAAWQYWTDEDWAEKMPDTLVLPLSDTPPDASTNVFSRNPESQWTIEETQVVVTYTSRAKTQEELDEEATNAAKQVARNTLVELDKVLPRALEDTWVAQEEHNPGFLLTLPQIQQDRLAAKQAARAIITG